MGKKAKEQSAETKAAVSSAPAAVDTAIERLDDEDYSSIILPGSPIAPQGKKERIGNDIHYAGLMTVDEANPNGCALTGKPRTTPDGYGIISATCYGRWYKNWVVNQIIDRIDKYGPAHPETIAMLRRCGILYQASDLRYDIYGSLEERSIGYKVCSKDKKQNSSDENNIMRRLLERFHDVRGTGSTLTYIAGCSGGIKGCISVKIKSLYPITYTEYRGTQSLNGKARSGGGKGSETMGARLYKVKKCYYLVQGVIRGINALYNGFTPFDALIYKKGISEMLEGINSVSRPVGSIYWNDMIWTQGVQLEPGKTFSDYLEIDTGAGTLDYLGKSTGETERPLKQKIDLKFA